MSNNQSKSVLQRAVGGLFLLALIALIAVLLLQPSDKTHAPQQESASTQKPKPTLSITSKNNEDSESEITDSSVPAIILESESSKTIAGNNQVTEVVSEDIWQSVEQNSAPAQGQHITGQPIITASLDKPKTVDSHKIETIQKTPQQVTPKVVEPPKVSEKPKTTEKPKVADKPKTAPAPKLELISSANTTPKATTPAPTSSGKWYVQLGAFSNNANAQKLVNEFKQKGYNVRIQKDNQLNRVQIGPYATKKEAEQVQSRTKGGSLNPSIFQAK